MLFALLVGAIPIMSDLLSDAIVDEQLKALPGWERVRDSLQKEFIFDSFPSAIAFAVRLAFEAETVDHHPDIMIQYKRVKLTYSTHSAGGLTQKDIDGARIANQVMS